MGKQLLLKNILLELSRLPEVQVKHWYELIRKAGADLPNQADAVRVTNEGDFDWDNFIEEVMKNRDENNRQRMNRLGSMAND